MLKSLSCVAALLLTACFATAQGAESRTAKIGSPAPEFSLKDQNGNPVKLSDFKGKIVVLEWTNPECPFVQRHYKAKTMTHLAQQYKDKGVVWLAINSNSGDTTTVNRHWAQENHLAYPILEDSKGIVGKEYGAKSTPTMAIIDKTGKLVYRGGIDNDPDGDKSDRVNYVQKALDEVLAGKSVSEPVTKSYGCGVHYQD